MAYFYCSVFNSPFSVVFFSSCTLLTLFASTILFFFLQFFTLTTSLHISTAIYLHVFNCDLHTHILKFIGFTNAFIVQMKVHKCIILVLGSV